MRAPDFLPSPARATGAVPVRYRHLDSLRGIAAGLVMWLHFAQAFEDKTSPTPAFLGFLNTWPKLLDPGRMGVMIFFAISGFVIPRSFGNVRAGSVRRFLIRRFCRLYPAYWVSILGGLLLWRMSAQTWSWTALAANATMLPHTLGQPRLLGVYWTLEIELLFYGLCLGLYLARGLERRAVLASLVVVWTALPRLLKMSDRFAGTHWTLSQLQSTTLLSLAVMFWGALFRMAYDETGGFRRDLRAHWRSLGLVTVLALVLIDVPDKNLKWFLLGLEPGPLPGQLSVLLALVVFTVWVAWLRVDNTVLTYLGAISYSLYLFHLVAIRWVEWCISPGEAGLWLRPPLLLCHLASAALTVAIAAAVYRWVEKPAIAFGKAMTAQSRATSGE
ncbi:MAG: acyltransferase [Verrucomicrobia bacterium]|nr:acyltransferase [Verrucomicrobiota bacterium]